MNVSFNAGTSVAEGIAGILTAKIPAGAPACKKRGEKKPKESYPNAAVEKTIPFPPCRVKNVSC